MIWKIFLYYLVKLEIQDSASQLLKHKIQTHFAQGHKNAPSSTSFCFFLFFVIPKCPPLGEWLLLVSSASTLSIHFLFRMFPCLSSCSWKQGTDPSYSFPLTFLSPPPYTPLFPRGSVSTLENSPSILSLAKTCHLGPQILLNVPCSGNVT